MLKLVKHDEMYATSDWFVKSIALYHEEGLMKGVRIGRLEINPFAYNPMSGELKVLDDLDVEVRFLQSNHAKTEKSKSCSILLPSAGYFLSSLFNFMNLNQVLGMFFIL